MRDDIDKEVGEIMEIAVEIQEEVLAEAKRLYALEGERKTWDELHPYLQRLWIRRAEGQMKVDGRLSF